MPAQGERSEHDISRSILRPISVEFTTVYPNRQTSLLQVKFRQGIRVTHYLIHAIERTRGGEWSPETMVYLTAMALEYAQREYQWAADHQDVLRYM